MDWDGDGLLDLIVGDRPGNVHFFKRLEYGNIYMEEQPLVAAGGVRIDVGYNSAPSVVDWNGNGLPDLVVGCLSPLPAGIFLFVNEGAPFAPEFLFADTVFYCGEPIEITTAYPDFADMNNDGLTDMIVGSSSGYISCFVNSGIPQQPLFNYMEYLRSDGEDLHMYSYVRPSICDWNDDGTPDVLVADYTGLIYLYLGIPQAGVQQNPEPVITLGSNPVTDCISIGITLTSPAETDVKLYSVQGRLVLRESYGTLPEGHNLLSLPASELSQGSYLIRITSGRSAMVSSVILLD